MQDILLSHKQYKSLLRKLEEINEDVTSIKLKSSDKIAYLDNYDLIKLLQVTYRTIQRWRNTGRLPYCKIGRRFYYRTDILLDRFKLHPDFRVEQEHPPDETRESEISKEYMACEKCPLFLILNL